MDFQIGELFGGLAAKLARVDVSTPRTGHKIVVLVDGVVQA